MIVINFISGLTQNDDHFIAALMVAILFASTLDFIFGWTNARLNPDVAFSSHKALAGITQKIQRYITLIFFVAIAFLVVPVTVAKGAVYTLLIGYLASEANSMMSHGGLTEDGTDGSLLIDFLKAIFNKETK